MPAVLYSSGWPPWAIPSRATKDRERTESMVTDHNAIGVKGEEDQSQSGEAWQHLAGIRDLVMGYGAIEGLVVGEIFLPTMSAATMRSDAGRALVALLKTMDDPNKESQMTDERDNKEGRAKEGDFADEHPSSQFSAVPFLVCTLEHPETGVRIAVLGASVLR